MFNFVKEKEEFLQHSKIVFSCEGLEKDWTRVILQLPTLRVYFHLPLKHLILSEATAAWIQVSLSDIPDLKHFPSAITFRI